MFGHSFGFDNASGGSAKSKPSNVNVTVNPVLTGTATSGSTLSVTTGSWTGSPSSYTYQWRRNSTVIAGATASTYVLTATEVGQLITVHVVASNGTNSGSANSNAIGPIA